MNRLLIVCGPTATGKTDLALELARRFDGELLSADSRQVYKGMDVGTGKDIPRNFQFSIFNFQKKEIPFYTDGKIRMWGLDVVNPDEEFSVAHYREYAQIILKDIFKRKKLPIVVGGTGLYIKSLLEPLSFVSIPRNEVLREKYEKSSLSELQNALKKIDVVRFENMNRSDRNNPRRLIRALEVGEYDRTHKSNKTHTTHEKKYNVLLIGLTAPFDILQTRIEKRVEKRLEQGIVNEVQTLLNKGYSLDLPSFSATGYKTIFTEKKKKDILRKWIQEEYRYAKRQMTWFNKQRNIEWFDTQEKNLQKAVVDRIQRWYTE